jgi:acyl-CoA hydrolase
MAAPKTSEIYSSVILTVGALFFLRSTYVLLTLPDVKGKNTTTAPNRQDHQPTKTKFVSQSAVSNVTYTANSEDCQATPDVIGVKPKLRAGALLKLIDIAAGVAARRHAGTSCVTISVDSVLFLKPIFLGDLIHLSASVNRAWGSSMEIGVRVMKSDGQSALPEYVSHCE